MSGLLSMLALGFFLGVRHATDPDHVIAITTIVARHRATTAAVLIGTAWGVGHTLTLLVVGGGIVLFGWVIPRHMGLSLEFAVAVMLVALGIANLSNLREVVRCFLPARRSAQWVHTHAHRHGDNIHDAPGAGRPAFWSRVDNRRRLAQSRTPSEASTSAAWARVELNYRPHAYQACALTT